MSDLTKLCEKLNLRIVRSVPTDKLPEGWDPGATGWTVTLAFEGRRMNAKFYMGSAHVGEPKVADVISSLCLDARSGEYDFEEFCSEFGYDTDSRSAYKTWQACHRAAPRVKRFLGESFEAVSESEH